MKKTVVILANLGTPNAPTSSAIRNFLRNFLSDRRVVELPRCFWLPILYLFILPFRAKKLVEQYEAIWQKNGSPLKAGMCDLTHALNNPLYDVMYAMSYSEPSIPTITQKCLDRQYSHVIIIPLYPQYTGSTTGAVFDQVFRALQHQRFIPKLTLLNNYCNHPAYIEALAKQITNFWQTHAKPQKLILSFHGIPQNQVKKGDPYATQCEMTASSLAKKLNLQEHEWMLVYQSRFGKAAWLQPYCDKTLEQLPKQDITTIHIFCPGFSMDCLETLEEISIQNKKLFIQSGGKCYHYIPALNASKDQCLLVKTLIQEVIDE